MMARTEDGVTVVTKVEPTVPGLDDPAGERHSSDDEVGPLPAHDPRARVGVVTAEALARQKRTAKEERARRRADRVAFAKLRGQPTPENSESSSESEEEPDDGIGERPVGLWLCRGARLVTRW